MSHHAIQLHRKSADLLTAAPGAAAAERIPPYIQDMAGESEWYRWHSLRIHYKKLGEGPPVVLLHTVDVGSSCIEWRKNFATVADTFTTYAVDLPGFGQSDVPHESLRADLYLRFVHDFITYVSQQRPECPKVRIVASGAGAAYAATVAGRNPSLIDRLVLIAPTGLSACTPNPLGSLAFHALGLPLVSSFQATASSRSGILEHLQRDVYGDDIRASMNEVDARYWVAHRPGAGKVERARLASLLNVNVWALIPSIKQPILLMWGRRAKCPPVDDAVTWKARHSRTLLGIFEQSGQCPHCEEPIKFNDEAMDFLSRNLDTAAEAI